MEKITEQVAEQTGEEIVALLQKRVTTIQGAIEILCITIIVLMKRLPPNEKEAMRQAVINGIKGSS
jgi:hypothetical protein